MNAIAMMLVFAALLGAGRAPFATGDETPIDPTSRVWITGASNVRRFTCRVRQLDGTLRLHGIATSGPVLSGLNRATEPSIRLVVERFECGIAAMNRHLRETLRASEHPVIAFRLMSYDVDLTDVAPVTRIVGEVTIAGITRAATVTAAVVPDSLGQVRVRGTYVVRMSDFRLEPPRRFGGLLRVRDHVAVHFDVVPGQYDGASEDIRSAIATPTKKPNSNSRAYHVAHD